MFDIPRGRCRETLPSFSYQSAQRIRIRRCCGDGAGCVYVMNVSHCSYRVPCRRHACGLAFMYAMCGERCCKCRKHDDGGCAEEERRCGGNVKKPLWRCDVRP